MRLVSIIGDSISTYEGFNPPGYEVFYKEEMLSDNEMNSVYDTWWAKVNQGLHALLCKNNSYSGSLVSGYSFPAACCEERTALLGNEWGYPDYILLYIGVNDFGNGVKISSGNKTAPDNRYFEDAYISMLNAIRTNCPDSRIVCGTIMRTKMKDRENWVFPEEYFDIPLEEYNEAIRRAAAQCGCYLADLSKTGVRYETLDGTHPTAAGHAEIANTWIKELARLELFSPSLEMSIKMFHKLGSNDMSVYMVFKSLANERILVPANEDGALIGLPFQDQTIIPIFTSPNEFGNEPGVSLRIKYMKDALPSLTAARKNIIINPFSEPEKQFILPYESLEKMLTPFL